jgi:hypothetical protein
MRSSSLKVYVTVTVGTKVVSISLFGVVGSLCRENDLTINLALYTILHIICARIVSVMELMIEVFLDCICKKLSSI